MSGQNAENAAPDLVRLLHEVDGHLGLAVYRGEGKSDRWKQEALDLIARIRSAIRQVSDV